MKMILEKFALFLNNLYKKKVENNSPISVNNYLFIYFTLKSTRYKCQLLKMTFISMSSAFNLCQDKSSS